VAIYGVYTKRQVGRNTQQCASVFEVKLEKLAVININECMVLVSKLVTLHFVLMLKQCHLCLNSSAYVQTFLSG